MVTNEQDKIPHYVVPKYVNIDTKEPELTTQTFYN